MGRVTQALPSLERLNELFSYDPQTGLLTNKSSRGRAKAGGVAGSLSAQGYVEIRVDYGRYLVHRLVWKMAYGKEPDHGLVVDHINSNKTDNRLANLRLVANRENCSKERTEKSGLPTGVSLCRAGKPYQTQIRLDGRSHSLGRYNTPEEGCEAYQTALVMYRNGFAPDKIKEALGVKSRG